MEEAAAFGIRYGFTVPVHDNRGLIAAVTFAIDQRRAEFERCIDEHARVLQLMTMYFHAQRRLACGRVIGGGSLSPREFECLGWAARGKSAWEIGSILGISRRTAAFHLDDAKAKLGVRSICQAVARLVAAAPQWKDSLSRSSCVAAQDVFPSSSLPMLTIQHHRKRVVNLLIM